MRGNRVTLKDISKEEGQLVELNPEEFMKLPPPYDEVNGQPPIAPLSDEVREKYECSLDGTLAMKIPKPKNKEEEGALVSKFLDGLRKLLSKEDNWTFVMPFLLSLEYCAKCQTCNEACPVYVSSGHNDIYRPT